MSSISTLITGLKPNHRIGLDQNGIFVDSSRRCCCFGWKLKKGATLNREKVFAAIPKAIHTHKVSQEQLAQLSKSLERRRDELIKRTSSWWKRLFLTSSKMQKIQASVTAIENLHQAILTKPTPPKAPEVVQQSLTTLRKELFAKQQPRKTNVEKYKQEQIQKTEDVMKAICQKFEKVEQTLQKTLDTLKKAVALHSAQQTATQPTKTTTQDDEKKAILLKFEKAEETLQKAAETLQKAVALHSAQQTATQPTKTTTQDLVEQPTAQSTQGTAQEEEGGKLKEEIELFKQANTLTGQGVGHFMNKRWDKATKYFRQSLAIDPKNESVWLSMASAHHQLEEWDEAIECYEEYLEQYPNSGNFDLWWGKFQAHEQKKEWKEAISCCDQLLDRVDENVDETKANAEMWRHKGRVLDKLKKYDEADICYTNALKYDACDYFAWDYQGTRFGRLEEWDKALECFDAAIKLNNDFIDAWYHKGNVYIRTEKWEVALDCFRKAREIAPKDFRLWEKEADVLCRLEKWGEAVYSYGIVTELNPDYKPAWHKKGYALIHYLKNYVFELFLTLETSSESTEKKSPVNKSKAPGNIQNLPIQSPFTVKKFDGLKLTQDTPTSASKVYKKLDFGSESDDESGLESETHTSSSSVSATESQSGSSTHETDSAVAE